LVRHGFNRARDRAFFITRGYDGRDHGL
jgi:hypothetical protein